MSQLCKKFRILLLCISVLSLLCSNICFLIFITPTLSASGSVTASSSVTASGSGSMSSLHAKYCALIDGDTGRLLYGKAADSEAPMASTTKIMTCYLALQLTPTDYICTTSSYAASMPDVQLNAVKGQQFHLSDLLYSLMLKSHNDTAVIIAENYAFHYLCENPFVIDNHTFQGLDLSFLTDEMLAAKDSSVLSTFSTEDSKTLVKIFALFMNQQASVFGCSHTYYITPNGLDSTDENGEHRTTAYELALIMSKCIKEDAFNKICQTKSHTFSDISGQSQYVVSNANAFLSMYDNILSGKTGFTGNAGYCYVCAYQADGRTFIVALLACGWPSNKTYKWQDTRLLLNYARENYFSQEILTESPLSEPVSVRNGDSPYAYVQCESSYTALLSASDQVNVLYQVPSQVSAPIQSNTSAGTADIYINDELVYEMPLRYITTVSRYSFFDHFKSKFKSITNTFCFLP